MIIAKMQKLGSELKNKFLKIMINKLKWSILCEKDTSLLDIGHG